VSQLVSPHCWFTLDRVLIALCFIGRHAIHRANRSHDPLANHPFQPYGDSLPGSASGRRESRKTIQRLSKPRCDIC